MKQHCEVTEVSFTLQDLMPNSDLLPISDKKIFFTSILLCVAPTALHVLQNNASVTNRQLKFIFNMVFGHFSLL